MLKHALIFFLKRHLVNDLLPTCTVLVLHSIPIIPISTLGTLWSNCIIKTPQTLSCSYITGIRIIHINVARTLTRLAGASFLVGVAKVTWCTSERKRSLTFIYKIQNESIDCFIIYKIY